MCVQLSFSMRCDLFQLMNMDYLELLRVTKELADYVKDLKANKGR